MPYVTRNTDGKVTGLYEEPKTGADEELDIEHPDVGEFLVTAKKDLFSSDVETIRVIEDIVDVLIEKKLILLTDLPQAAQRKLTERQRIRSELGSLGDLMVDEEDIL